MWFNTALLAVSAIPLLASALPGPARSDGLDFNVIVVGGDPSGLAATSSLTRVRRSVLMIDAGAYRNIAMRHQHNIPGVDDK